MKKPIALLALDELISILIRKTTTFSTTLLFSVTVDDVDMLVLC